MINNVAEKIKYFRDKLGFTQTDLAKRLGISRSAVNAWEMALSVPSLANMLELSEIFHVPVDTLLSEKNCVLVDISKLSHEERELVLRIIDCFEKRQ